VVVSIRDEHVLIILQSREINEKTINDPYLVFVFEVLQDNFCLLRLGLGQRNPLFVTRSSTQRTNTKVNSKYRCARITEAGQKQGRSSFLDNAIDRFLIISATRNRRWFREISKARPRRPQNPPPTRRHHRKIVILAFVLSSFLFFSLSPEFRDICVSTQDKSNDFPRWSSFPKRTLNWSQLISLSGDSY